ncbi:hypothetical protein COL91_24935 [Bacillus pseudomycoides]|nr:hypothetical protein COO02_26070 [Bacillus pseudomycoides]PGA85886.1 hypothetical protein COL91_24935 [Bacillus pseudomycoides]PHF50085.1 hypothetical protein COF72_05930 [Bacillus pseudomycoides]
MKTDMQEIQTRKIQTQWLFSVVLVQFFCFVITVQLINEIVIKHNITISHIAIQLASLIGMLMPTPLASICKKLCENQFLLSIILTQFGFLLLILSHSIALYVAICIISLLFHLHYHFLLKKSVFVIRTIKHMVWLVIHFFSFQGPA